MSELIASTSPTTESNETFLRVKAGKVSLLLDLVGELSLATMAVTHHPDLEGLELTGFENAVHHLDMLIREVQDLTSALRLVSVEGVFKRMQRLIRDLNRETGKTVELTLVGEDTELDKALVDRLTEPLIHLIRNAVDHGIESPDQRAAAGKPAAGNITLSASQHGSEIHLTVADDGSGLDRAAILERARSAGLLSPTEEPDDQTVWQFIFQPGFSTAQNVSNLSGRGVGLDVVQTALNAMHGQIFIQTQPGQGTRLTLRIPLTLAFIDSLVVKNNNRLYTLPLDVVQEIFSPGVGQITHSAADNTDLVRVRQQMIPLCSLTRFYHYTGLDQRPVNKQLLIVVHTLKGPLIIAVDEVLSQQQVTLKPLQGHLKNIRAAAGYALSGSGEIAIALDVEQIAQDILD